MDLASLFSALQTTQQAKSQVKLSDRNVIELVNKLKQLGILGDDLLYTINGKEYITTARLKQEVAAAVKQAGGRLALVELPALLGVDLVHCERQAAVLISESGGTIQEAQGEILTTQYFEAISAEINDMLQESGQLSIAELALQYRLNTELVITMITQNIGKTIKGRLEGGLLYTPSALRRIKAQMRGALRGVVQPSSLPAIVKDLGLEGFVTSGTMISSIVEELVAAGEVTGVIKAGGTGWTPHVYANAQQAALTTFFEQNGWIGYDMAKKLGFSGEGSALAKLLPGGIALSSAFVSPTVLTQMQASVEEAVSSGSWVDVAPLLPPVLSTADVTTLLEQLPQASESGAAGEPGALATRILAGTCAVSGSLLTQLAGHVNQWAREGAEKALVNKKSAAVSVSDRAVQPQAASKTPTPKKPSKQVSDDEDADWGASGKKGGKGGGKAAKGKAKAGGGKASGAKSSSGPGGAGDGSGAPGVDVGQIAEVLRSHVEDMEGAGEGGALLEEVAEVLLPGAVAAWEAALVNAFTAGAEARRQAKDALSKALDESFNRLCLYSSGLELFAPPASESDPAAAEPSSTGAGGKGASKSSGSKSTSSKAAAAGGEGGEAGEDGMYQVMEKHVIRSAGMDCVDLLFKWVKVELSAQSDAPVSAQPAAGAQASLTPAERATLMRSAPPDMAAALQLAAGITGAASIKAATSAIEESADQLGLRMKRPDKKSEKAGVTSVKAGLLSQLVPEQDPAVALTLLVPLLFIKATGRAIQLPGKAIGTVLSHITKDLPEEHVTSVHRFHAKVVEYLKASSAPGGAPALAEELAGILPDMKALVGAATEGGAAPAAVAP